MKSDAVWWWLKSRGKVLPLLSLPRMPRPTRNWLQAREAAAALTATGFPTATATLEKLATVGGGPTYRKYGRKVIYDRDDLFAWAEARARRVASTSEQAG